MRIGNRLYRLRPPALYDDVGMARGLEQMAQQGWLLDKIGPDIWRYRRAAPQKLHYAVVYDEQGLAADDYHMGSGPSLREQYLGAGWTEVSLCPRIGVFCSDAEKPARPEQDRAQKLERIHTEMKRSLLRGSYFLLVLTGVLLALLVWALVHRPISSLSHFGTPFLHLMIAALLSDTAVQLCAYAHWRKINRQRQAADGLPVGGRWRWASRVLQGLGLALLLILVVLEPGLRLLVLLAGVIFIYAATAAMQELLDRWQIEGKVIRFVLMFALIFGLSQVEPQAHFVPQQGQLIFAAEDMVGAPHQPEDYRIGRQSRSVLLSYTHVYRARAEEASQPFAFPFSYMILESRLQPMLGICLEELLSQNRGLSGQEHYRPADAAPWQAGAVYQLYDGAQPLQEYIASWEGRLVRIYFDEMPTAEQFSIAAAQLRPEHP